MVPENKKRVLVTLNAENWEEAKRLVAELGVPSLPAQTLSAWFDGVLADAFLPLLRKLCERKKAGKSGFGALEAVVLIGEAFAKLSKDLEAGEKGKKA